MPTLWQLRKISTQENLNEPQPLPENWGSIFGMEGFKDKLNDLSWIGEPDLGWFKVEVSDSQFLTNENKKFVDSQIEHLLLTSLDFVALDNTTLTKQQRSDWIEYRKQINEIPLQPGYPNEIYWPKRPDVE
jgi:hypothetical protein